MDGMSSDNSEVMTRLNGVLGDRILGLLQMGWSGKASGRR